MSKNRKPHPSKLEAELGVTKRNLQTSEDNVVYWHKKHDDLLTDKKKIDEEIKRMQKALRMVADELEAIIFTSSNVIPADNNGYCLQRAVGLVEGRALAARSLIGNFDLGSSAMSAYRNLEKRI